MPVIQSPIHPVLSNMESNLGSSKNGLTPGQQVEVANAFESVFLSLLVKQLRQAAGEEGLFAGDKSDTFGGIFDLYMGQHLSQVSDLGIGTMVTDAFERAATDE